MKAKQGGQLTFNVLVIKGTIKNILVKGLYIFAFPVVILMRILSPIILIRIGMLYSFRIGHFGGNTELYLCERDAGINKPRRITIDFFFMVKPICNKQLAVMWKRVLTILPVWVLTPIFYLNKKIPGGSVHEVGNNTNMDRDVHNLLDCSKPHLSFTNTEEKAGQEALRKMNIPANAKFACLLVRDRAYLQTYQPGEDWSSHDYRDTDIQDYVLACETLADMGYYVLRMGAIVKKKLNSNHPKVIDYATNGMRSDFLDIYLGSKCEFCISTGSGWDAVPLIFRRPIVFVNLVPLGRQLTFCQNMITIPKKYYDSNLFKELTLNEIIESGAAFNLDSIKYKSRGIRLVDNSPEEIRDVVVEMAKRIAADWIEENDDKILQEKFWKIFPVKAVDSQNRRLHGNIHSRFGAAFLSGNTKWLN